MIPCRSLDQSDGGRELDPMVDSALHAAAYDSLETRVLMSHLFGRNTCQKLWGLVQGAYVLLIVFVRSPGIFFDLASLRAWAPEALSLAFSNPRLDYRRMKHGFDPRIFAWWTS